MLSDETFPNDLFYDDDEEQKEQEERSKSLQIKGQKENEMVKFSLNHETSKSIDNFTSYLSSSVDFDDRDDQSTLNSTEHERLIKSSDFENITESSNKFEELDLLQPQPEASFKSINVSSQKTSILPPPCAPIKKKKSFSCHDLQSCKNVKKKNYDHVESKVKKLIENLAEDRRRKTLMRHTSMPVCPQTVPIVDEKSSDEEYDTNRLKRELRNKSIKIYELEEKCDMKDNQIYHLECERSKMKMTFDKLRMEMQELKEIEKQYKQLKSLTSPNKTLKNAQIQTEDSGFDEFSKFHLTATTYNHSNYKNVNRLLSSTRAIRQLAFDNSTNQSHFTEINNTSSDNLIPEQEDLYMEEVDLTNTGAAITMSARVDQNASTVQKTKKPKKPKLRRFFRLVPCISKNK